MFLCTCQQTGVVTHVDGNCLRNVGGCHHYLYRVCRRDDMIFHPQGCMFTSLSESATKCHSLKWFVFHEVRVLYFSFNLTDAINSSNRREKLFCIILLYMMSHGAPVHNWAWLRFAVLKTSRKTWVWGLQKTNQDDNTDRQLDKNRESSWIFRLIS